MSATANVALPEGALSVLRAGPSEFGDASVWRTRSLVEMLIDHKNLALEKADVVAAAVAQFRKRPTIGFSDCLIVEVARKAGHIPVGTFDRELGKLADVELRNHQSHEWWTPTLEVN